MRQELLAILKYLTLRVEKMTTLARVILVLIIPGRVKWLTSVVIVVVVVVP